MVKSWEKFLKYTNYCPKNNYYNTLKAEENNPKEAIIKKINNIFYKNLKEKDIENIIELLLSEKYLWWEYYNNNIFLSYVYKTTLKEFFYYINNFFSKENKKYIYESLEMKYDYGKE